LIFSQQLEYFAGFGVPLRFRFLEYGHTVAENFEASAA
jgi:hypothetical protein